MAIIGHLEFLTFERIGLASPRSFLYYGRPRPLGESGACPPPGARPPHHVSRTRVPPGEYYFSEDDASTIRHHFLRHDTRPGVSVFAEVNKTS